MFDFELIQQVELDEEPQVGFDDIEFLSQFSHTRNAYVLLAGVIYYGKRYVVQTSILPNQYENMKWMADLKQLAYQKIIETIKDDPPPSRRYRGLARDALTFILEAFAPKVEPETDKVNWIREGF